MSGPDPRRGPLVRVLLLAGALITLVLGYWLGNLYSGKTQSGPTNPSQPARVSQP